MAGCDVAAYDLTSGNQLWRTRLQAISVVAHSFYSNRVTMSVARHLGPDREDEGIVEIHGREHFGDYIEILDRDTGRILAHKTYPKPKEARKVSADAPAPEEPPPPPFPLGACLLCVAAGAALGFLGGMAIVSLHRRRFRSITAISPHVRYCRRRSRMSPPDPSGPSAP
jgi:hypothetical protein